MVQFAGGNADDDTALLVLRQPPAVASCGGVTVTVGAPADPRNALGRRALAGVASGVLVCGPGCDDYLLRCKYVAPRGGACAVLVSVQPVGGSTVLTITGEIDLATAPTLREHLSGVVDGGALRVVVDLSGVGFLDSTGLGVLVGVLKKLQRVDGTLIIVCPHERMLKVFRLTALDRVFTIRATVGEALK